VAHEPWDDWADFIRQAYNRPVGMPVEMRSPGLAKAIVIGDAPMFVMYCLLHAWLRCHSASLPWKSPSCTKHNPRTNYCPRMRKRGQASDVADQALQAACCTNHTLAYGTARSCGARGWRRSSYGSLRNRTAAVFDAARCWGRPP
jgi:hypothetical protein